MVYIYTPIGDRRYHRDMAFNLREILRALAAAEVDYAVVGGFAADLRQLLDGRRLSNEAKADFFEEMTSLAFQAGARDQLETWRFVILAPGAAQRDIALVTAGKGERLRVPYEVSLERAAAALRFETFAMTPDHVRRLQESLVQPLREQGIHARAHEVAADILAQACPWPVDRFVLLRIPAANGRRIIEGEWALPRPRG
jgi:hypothetical protein